MISKCLVSFFLVIAMTVCFSACDQKTSKQLSDKEVIDILNGTSDLFEEEKDQESFSKVTTTNQKIVSSQYSQDVKMVVNVDYSVKKTEKGSIKKIVMNSDANGTKTKETSYYSDGYCYSDSTNGKIAFPCTENEYLNLYGLGENPDHNNSMLKEDQIKSITFVKKDGKNIYTIEIDESFINTMLEQEIPDDITFFSIITLDINNIVLSISFDMNASEEIEQNGVKYMKEINMNIIEETKAFIDFSLPDFSDYEKGTYDEEGNFIPNENI